MSNTQTAVAAMAENATAAAAAKTDGTPAAAAAATEGKPAATSTAEAQATAAPAGKADEKPADGATPPDGKTGEKPADTQEKPAAAAEGAPEKYELALPDGGPFEAEDLALFEKYARTHNLTNEQAQAALDSQLEAIAFQSEQFLEATKADTEIGGDNLPIAQQHARRVIDRFLPADSPEGKQLRKALDSSGYGNFTPLVKLFARIGKAMGEDRPEGGAPPAAQKSATEVFWPESSPTK